jgi:hypothetical protein
MRYRLVYLQFGSYGAFHPYIHVRACADDLRYLAGLFNNACKHGAKLLLYCGTHMVCRAGIGKNSKIDAQRFISFRVGQYGSA